MTLDYEQNSRAKLDTGQVESDRFEAFAYYEAARGLSGDYYNFEKINDRYHWFTICDISGNGIAAALLMAQVAAIVATYFGEWKKRMPSAIDLTELTYKVNDFLNEQKLNGRFAEIILGILDEKEGTALLCGACEVGLSNYYIWRSSGAGIFITQLPQAPALGPIEGSIIAMMAPFSQVTLQLDHGDILLLCTDGLANSKRHFRDEKATIRKCDHEGNHRSLFLDRGDNRCIRDESTRQPYLRQPVGVA